MEIKGIREDNMPIDVIDGGFRCILHPDVDIDVASRRCHSASKEFDLITDFRDENRNAL